MAEASSSDENVVRYINNKLMSVERAFIHDEGLPGRPYFKYVGLSSTTTKAAGHTVHV